LNFFFSCFDDFGWFRFKKEKLLEEFIAQGFPISRFNWLIKAAFTEFAKKPSLGKSVRR
jgi:hypothetical protein